MGYSIQEVNRAIDHAKNGCVSDDEKKALAYMASCGQAGHLVSEASYWLNKVNK